mmetsp:Transcript_8995/g.21272  ORF Transcript_8995/g.21272 Transcript_8995/m.21272 type:complete len:323 (+) Transcript_8995:1252-2220(+)
MHVPRLSRRAVTCAILHCLCGGGVAGRGLLAFDATGECVGDLAQLEARIAHVLRRVATLVGEGCRLARHPQVGQAVRRRGLARLIGLAPHAPSRRTLLLQRVGLASGLGVTIARGAARLAEGATPVTAVRGTAVAVGRAARLVLIVRATARRGAGVLTPRVRRGTAGVGDPRASVQGAVDLVMHEAAQSRRVRRHGWDRGLPRILAAVLIGAWWRGQRGAHSGRHTGVVTRLPSGTRRADLAARSLVLNAELVRRPGAATRTVAAGSSAFHLAPHLLARAVVGAVWCRPGGQRLAEPATEHAAVRGAARLVLVRGAPRPRGQ